MLNNVFNVIICFCACVRTGEGPETQVAGDGAQENVREDSGLEGQARGGGEKLQIGIHLPSPCRILSF